MNVPDHPITIDGLTPDQWLALPAADLDDLVLTGRPITFRAGTATVLGQFSIDTNTNRLTVELAHIDGGGEGILPTLASLTTRLARQRGLSQILWRVHAARCASPNPKLRRILERRGFTLAGAPGAEVYELLGLVAQQ